MWLEFVAHFLLLGFEVAGVFGLRHRFDWHLLDDFEFVTFEADNFARVVGHEQDFAHAEVGDDLRADTVVTKVHGKPSLRLASTVSRPCSWSL